MNNQIENILEKLNRSKFRSSFHLKEKDVIYIQNKGIDTIRKHANDFINQRLSSANIANDGKQTPYKGHPVFIAQHATATCCRGCLEKWHHIPKNTELTKENKEYIITLIMAWIKHELIS